MRAFTDALDVQLDAILQSGGQVGTNWYLGNHRTEARSLRALIEDAPEALHRSMPESYILRFEAAPDPCPVIDLNELDHVETVVHRWLESRVREVLDTVLNSELATQVCQEEPAFAGSMLNLALSVAEGDFQNALDYLGHVAMTHAGAFCRLLDFDTDRNDGRFKLAMPEPTAAPEQPSFVPRLCSSMLRGPFSFSRLG